MKRLGVLALAALAGGCLAAKVPATSARVAASAKPTFEDCATRVKDAVEKYLPIALEFPANSAKRALYLELLETEEQGAEAGQTPFGQKACRELYARVSRAKAAEIESRTSLPVAADGGGVRED